MTTNDAQAILKDLTELEFPKFFGFSIIFALFKLPGDDGNKYAPEGWTFDELGPQALKSKGVKEMNDNQVQLASQNRGNCPFRLA
ncbi:hypothetical protein P7C71_g3072, partial [Lecanoromycetidae sp. Uapishka_2]